MDRFIRNVRCKPQIVPIAGRPARRGAILPLVAALLPVVLVMVAMFVNVAYMELTRTELRISTDSAARAAGRELALTGDMTAAIAKGRDAATRNAVAGAGLQLADSDFTFGTSERPTAATRYQFSANNTNPNAISVTGRRTEGSLSGPIPLFLPSILGVGQFEPVQVAHATRVELDISLIIDRSGSMAYAADENADPYQSPETAPADWTWGDPVPSNSRWLDVIAGTQAFLNELNASPQSEQVCLSTYSDFASSDRPLTTDYFEIINSLDLLSQSFEGGGTNIGDGLETGLFALSDAGSRPWAAKVIILMTDGIFNTGTNPNQAADHCATANVTVYTITFSDEANQSSMKKVAKKTGGAHYHATTPAALVQAFEDIAKSLPTLLTH